MGPATEFDTWSVEHRMRSVGVINDSNNVYIFLD